MLPSLLSIREDVKSAVSELFQARENIYKTLMKLDLFMEYLPNLQIGRKESLQILAETQHSNFVMTTNEALGISEKEIEVTQTMKIPKQSIYKNYLLLQNRIKKGDKPPKEFTKKYKIRKLVFDH